MNETFDSVLLFHTALKTFLTDTVGLTVDRTVAAHDDILTNGAGLFLRLRKKVNGGTHSVGMELGADADVLELSTRDPELSLPFDTASGGAFQGELHWFPDASRAEITVRAGGDRWSKRYLVGLNLSPGGLTVTHHDHLNKQLEPNFKQSGGPFVQAGA